MNKYTLIIFLFCTSNYAFSQGSRIFDNLTIPSKILGKTVQYSVYLPDGYETSHRSYPVVYLLHGGGPFDERHTAWIVSGDLQRIVDEGIKNGSIAPSVIVTANVERSYYMNSADGKAPVEDFYIKEFIPFVEKTYRCRTEKKYRGIMGFSMGGFGALLYAFKHPDLFSSCVALSSAIRTDDEIRAMPLEQYLPRHSTNMGNLKEGEERVTDHWKQNHPLHLAKNLPAEQLKKVKYYIDCGDDDYLYKGNSVLHITLRERGIPHEFRIRDGAHNWTYWQQGLVDGLGFLSDGFR